MGRQKQAGGDSQLSSLVASGSTQPKQKKKGDPPSSSLVASGSTQPKQKKPDPGKKKGDPSSSLVASGSIQPKQKKPDPECWLECTCPLKDIRKLRGALTVSFLSWSLAVSLATILRGHGHPSRLLLTQDA